MLRRQSSSCWSTNTGNLFVRFRELVRMQAAIDNKSGSSSGRHRHFCLISFSRRCDLSHCSDKAKEGSVTMTMVGSGRGPPSSSLVVLGRLLVLLPLLATRFASAAVSSAPTTQTCSSSRTADDGTAHAHHPRPMIITTILSSRSAASTWRRAPYPARASEFSPRWKSYPAIPSDTVTFAFRLWVRTVPACVPRIDGTPRGQHGRKRTSASDEDCG